ncbi:glycosyltransferase family 2 protein [Thermodesulfobacteriota bacterium]
MRVSLIVTTYNRPDALEKVLKALENQTRLPDEVVVADDGSGPETAEIIVRQTKNMPFCIEHVRQEDDGFRAARIRNKAIRKTSGEYIILLDGDCVVPKQFVEDHVHLAQDGFFIQGKRILLSRSFSSYFDREYAGLSLKLILPLISGNISNTHHLLRIPWFPSFISTRLNGIKTCNMSFFRKHIFSVNGFNENFVGWGREDSELAVRFFKYGLKRKTHPFMAVCFHLWHEENKKVRLKVNDEILKRSIESNEYFCIDGLEKRKRT